MPPLSASDRPTTRRFVPADLPRILEIEAACFPSYPYDEAVFLVWARREPDLFRVLELGGAVVAYVIAGAGANRGHIVSLAVDPPVRRRRLGTLLVDETLRRLRRRGAAVVELETRLDSPRTIRFWRLQGFAPTGVLPRYYEDGAAALTMRLEIAP